MSNATIHTLGPENTNCEKAAYHWKQANKINANVVLHPTIEAAAEAIRQCKSKDSVLLACAVYPELHNVVFENLDWMNLEDSFIMPTMEMILVAREPLSEESIRTVACHPAPSSLVRRYQVLSASSNAVAARMCANKEVDAAVTTRKAAEHLKLSEIKNFGEVPMCFTIHSKRS